MLQRLCLLLFCCVSNVSAEQINGLEWLKKMQWAMKSLNYQGTVAFMGNGQLDTMRYIHAVKNGREQERLLSLNSPMREVVRESGKVSCTYKETKKRIVNHRPVSQSFIINLPQQLDELEKVYEITIGTEESVAMRLARVINIKAKDAYRYNRKLWVDQQVSLPLKIEVYQDDGTILEQVMFTDIKVDEAIPFVFLENENQDFTVQHIHQVQSEPFENALFDLANLPKGFEKIFFTRMSMHKSAKPVDHLLLSDGFSSISIYLDGKDEKIENGLQTLGSVNSYSFTKDNIQVTVMGEVPAKTVEFIAHGIQFN